MRSFLVTSRSRLSRRTPRTTVSGESSTRTCAATFGGNQVGLDIGAQVGVQLTAALIAVVWAGVGSYVLLKLVDMLIGLRVEEEHESSGLDLALHDERGYNM